MDDVARSGRCARSRRPPPNLGRNGRRSCRVAPAGYRPATAIDAAEGGQGWERQRQAGRVMGQEAPQEIVTRIERGFQLIGYQGPLLRRDYSFADVVTADDVVYTIPLALFGQDPPSARNACFGVVPPSTVADRARYRSLGASQLWDAGPNGVVRWGATATGAFKRLETIAPDRIEDAIQERADIWNPTAMLRARAIRVDATPRQLDFYDTGLIPTINTLTREKLDRLLGETIAASRAAYREFTGETPDYRQLFRLVFRLLAAKLLADRGHPGDQQPGEWQQEDAGAVLAAVERYYFRGRDVPPAIDEPRTQGVVWNKIRSSFHLQNISLETLAHIYENTFVDAEQRKALGIHSTPPEVAEYLVRHLHLDRLPLDERRVYEPFVGHGALLTAAMTSLKEMAPLSMDGAARHTYLVAMLAGADIDPFALEVAQWGLNEADYPQRNSWRLDEGDVFSSPSVDEQLRRARIVLCNPPFENFTRDESKRYKRLRLENETYRGLRSSNKAADALIRTLEHAPDMLGFVLPTTFINGRAYKRARQMLIETYGTIRLLALPDTVFQHSESKPILLMASGKEQAKEKERVHVWCGTVRSDDYGTFQRTGRVLDAREATLSRSALVAARSLWIPDLDRVWDALSRLPTMGDVADVHRGIEYNGNLKTFRDHYMSAQPQPGFAPGLAQVTDGFEPFLTRDHVYLNMDKDVMRTNAYALPWDKPKVLVNAARRTRKAWVLTAVPDRGRLVAYQRFIGVWPKEDMPGLIPVDVLAAILNGPVANAFLKVWSTAQDNQVGWIQAIPVPRLTYHMVRTIARLVRIYQDVLGRWAASGGEAAAGVYAAHCKTALERIDAAVLRAYDLPPHLERELLDFFDDARRPGPVPFDRYYPKDLPPAQQWSVTVMEVLADRAVPPIGAVPPLVPLAEDDAAPDPSRSVRKIEEREPALFPIDADALAGLYDFIGRDGEAATRQRVAAFIEQHPFLTDVLVQAPGVVERFFPRSLRGLDVWRDPQGGIEQMILSVRTDIPAGEAVNRWLRMQRDPVLDTDERLRETLTVMLRPL